MNIRSFSRIIALLTLVAFMLSAGCATIFTGTSDIIGITSEPSGAKVFVDGLYIGSTPASSSLKRSNDHQIVIRKEGYEDASANLQRSFNAVAILNLASILCWVVDIVTGAVWKFDRSGITVTLDKKSTKSGSIDAHPGKIVAGDNMKVVPYEGRTGVVLLNAQAAH